MADGIATYYFLLFCQANVIALWQMEKPHIFYCVVMADVIAQQQMEWPLRGGSVLSPGRHYSQGADGCSWVEITLVSVLRCYAEPHPIYEADSICLCSCSGMDCLPL